MNKTTSKKNLNQVTTIGLLADMLTNYAQYQAKEGIKHTFTPQVLYKNHQHPVKKSNSQNTVSKVDDDIKKLAPVFALKVLNNIGLLNIASEKRNTRIENFYYVEIPNSEKKYKFSARTIEGLKSNHKASSKLVWVDSYTGRGGKGTVSLLTKLAEDGVFNQLLPDNKYSNDQFRPMISKFKELLNAYQKAGNDLFTIETEGMVDGLERINRLPEIENNPSKNKAIYSTLSDLRKLSTDTVKLHIDKGDVAIGTHFNEPDNKLYYNQLFCKMTDSKGFDVSQKSHTPANYQRLYVSVDKETGKKKLQKRFVRGSYGQFAGTPKPQSKILWMTEAVVNFMSFNELQNELKNNQLGYAEDNAISVLSTGGLQSFLSNAFGIQIHKDKALTVEVLTSEKPEERQLTESEHEQIKRFFDGNNFFYIKSSNEPDEYLKQIGYTLLASKTESKITPVEENDQFRVLKYLAAQANPKNYVMDKETVTQFLKNTGLVIDMSSGTPELRIREVKKVYKKWHELSINERNQKITEVKTKLRNQFGCEQLGAGFDRDKAGYEAANVLRKFTQCIGIKYNQCIPKVELPTGLEGVTEINDQNDVLMAYKELQTANRNDEATHLLKQYSASIKVNLDPNSRPQQTRKIK